MKMPEGWNRRQYLLEKGISLCLEDHQETLDLMKEMAEALERADRALDLHFPKMQVMAVLKKFKDWK